MRGSQPHRQEQRHHREPGDSDRSPTSAVNAAVARSTPPLATAREASVPGAGAGGPPEAEGGGALVEGS